MSLKFDKHFFRGLFTLEESNKYLFITPLCYFLMVIILCIGSSFIPVRQGAEPPIQSLMFVFSGLAGFFTVSTINIYLYKHVLRYNPFKDTENEENKVASVFALSLFSGMIIMYTVPFLLGDLVNSTSKAPFLSLNTLGYIVGSVILFALIQSFFKFFVLDQINSIMTKKNQVEELKEI